MGIYVQGMHKNIVNTDHIMLSGSLSPWACILMLWMEENILFHKRQGIS